MTRDGNHAVCVRDLPHWSMQGVVQYNKRSVHLLLTDQTTKVLIQVLGAILGFIPELGHLMHRCVSKGLDQQRRLLLLLDSCHDHHDCLLLWVFDKRIASLSFRIYDKFRLGGCVPNDSDDDRPSMPSWLWCEQKNEKRSDSRDLMWSGENYALPNILLQYQEKCAINETGWVAVYP